MFEIFDQVIRYNLVWCSLRLIKREAVYEKHKLYQTRLYKYNLFKNIPYNLIFTTKFNEPSILITIISCDYLNLSLANEYAGYVTILTRLSIITKTFSKRISQSDCSIQIKLYYFFMFSIALEWR